MVIVVFKSTPRPGIDRVEYERTFGRMFELASQMPGFHSIEGYSSEGGDELAIVRFESEETLAAWRNQPEHVRVQERARTEFYDAYQTYFSE